MADFTIKQGETLPVLSGQLLYANKTPVDLTGASVTLQMRDMTKARAVTLTGQGRVLAAKEGAVAFEFSEADTSIVGDFSANWLVTFNTSQQMLFPTTGYMEIQVERNLAQEGGQTLIGLPYVKDYLNIPANDSVHDEKLLRFIRSVRPVIENMVGPILPTVFKEYHDGGNYFISLRRRPSTSLGTNPVYRLVACSEYRGPIEYPLAIIPNPAQGTIYSCMFHSRRAIVERRTSGGGVMAFPPMASSVHVVYEAGQETVPENVQEAALESVRVFYQTTQTVGTGRMTVADAEELASPFGGVYLPRRARELLQPNRRAPSIF